MFALVYLLLKSSQLKQITALPIPQIKRQQQISTPQKESPNSKTRATSAPSPIPTPQIQGIGALHINIFATVFWVGEEASNENNFISNERSFWDANWEENYGGYDDPEERKGFHPKEFTPKENPFYFALPYADFESGNKLKENTRKIPWFTNNSSSGSIVKNRWIAVGANGNICYAQWQDVGPAETDDFEYVFGSASPKNNFSGLDVSPATRDCLEMGDRQKVWWQFVKDSDVPDGPWKKIVTTSGINW